MTFKLNLNLKINESENYENLNINLEKGQVLFVMGANGTGKSSLMYRFFVQNKDKAKRIIAHRQNWMTSNSTSLSPEQIQATTQQIQNQDAQVASRVKDAFAQHRPHLAVYSLLEAENEWARKLANAACEDDHDLIKKLKEKRAPIHEMNELLSLSNLPIQVRIGKNSQVFAKKGDSAEYGVNELSDGERNALLMIATVLTEPKNSLIIIDEPERHLHRSIISPLLTSLFLKRKDCSFVVSTHDHTLPLDNPEAMSLLLRECIYKGSEPHAWRADQISKTEDIDDDLLFDLLGSRRKILFVEGTEASLDKPLYSAIFKDYSVISKGSCREVERAVKGLNDSANLHWVNSIGIIDNDRRPKAELESLKESGIFSLGVYSVESIYFHPEVQLLAAQRQHDLIGGKSPEERVEDAKIQVIKCLPEHRNRLCELVAELSIRKRFFSKIPERKDLFNEEALSIELNAKEILNEELSRFDNALEKNDIIELIKNYPLRTTQALDRISKALEFKDADQYKDVVRKMLIDDNKSRRKITGLLGSVVNEITSDLDADSEANQNPPGPTEM